MAFQSPIMLLGLLGLLIPIAIHLWSRQKPRLIKMGTIKYVNTSEIKKARNIKLTQVPLLILRMAILIILVLLLSELSINSQEDNTKSALLFEKKMLEESLISDQISALESRVDESFTFESYGVENQDFYRVIQVLDSKGYDTIHVFTHGFYNNYQGIKPVVSANIKWNLIPYTQEYANDVPLVYKLDSNSFLEIKSSSSHASVSIERVNFELLSTPNTYVYDLTGLKVAIYRNGALYTDNNELLLRSGFKAIERWLNIDIDYIPLNSPQSESNFDILVFMDKASQLEQLTLNAEKVISFSDMNIQVDSKEKIINDNLVYLIPQTLIESPQVYAGYGLSDRLLALITDVKTDIIDLRSIERVEDLELNSSSDTIEPFQTAGVKSLPLPLLLLLLLFVLIERYYSTFYLTSKDGK